MNLRELRDVLIDKLKTDDRTVRYDRRSELLRIENTNSKKGVTIGLSDLMNQVRGQGTPAIDDYVQVVDRTLKSMETDVHLKGHERQIFPVIRAASFPQRTAAGKQLLCREHTAETKIFYALDLGGSYRLIDRELIEREQVDEQTVIESAYFNLQALPTRARKDVVDHNFFYFINYNDGYDASRILNRRLLERMKQRAKGDLAVGVPHQDVLIFGDLVNPAGYDMLEKIMMKFYAEGRIPITILPFIYEGGELEPIFVLSGKRKTPGSTDQKSDE
ncbi:MAG: DUF1444 domain-containing protein [Sporolactobacillus sp.]|jgi:uncharacterized protein YtpQ (UPF0354 family)|nr:DUF1444 domain-containing protein [Sporolactobacillus sp.]